jgi:hypothetical protein
MKKILFILFVIILFSCVNSGTPDTPGNNPDWGKAMPEEIEGLVEYGRDNYICIVTNWDSKSRVSNYVYGDLYTELKKNVGKIVKVKGKFLEGSGRWENYILVEEIINISQESLKNY